MPKKTLTLPRPDDIECAVYQVFRSLLIGCKRLPVGIIRESGTSLHFHPA
jgi:hypothetical protein